MDLLTFVVLCLVWAIAEWQGGQWFVIMATLLAWNVLVVRSGERLSYGVSGEKQGSTAAPATLLLLGAVALLAGTAILDSALRESALYPGREAIGFIVISLPLMVYANVYFQKTHHPG